MLLLPAAAHSNTGAGFLSLVVITRNGACVLLPPSAALYLFFSGRGALHNCAALEGRPIAVTSITYISMSEWQPLSCWLPAVSDSIEPLMQAAGEGGACRRACASGGWWELAASQVCIVASHAFASQAGVYL